MKNRILFFLAFSLFFTACSKDNGSDDKNNPPAQDSFVNTTSGSTWEYHTDNNSNGASESYDYLVTSTDRDTSMFGKKYHVYTYSNDQNHYLCQSGHDYYSYDSLPGTSSLGGLAVERLYLKDNLDAGATWDQNFTFNVSVSGIPVSIPLKVSNKIAEKGISRIVNNITYQDVTHVSATLSSSMIPSSSLTSAIDSYYAPKYGLIENSTKVTLDYMGITGDVDIKTHLNGAVLK